MELIIGLAVILCVAVVLIAFRVSTLVDIAKATREKSKLPTVWNSGQATLFIIFMIVGILAFFYFSIKEYDTYNLPVASEHGVTVETLFWVTMAITVFVFVVTQIFLFVFAAKYQHKEGNNAMYYPHNNKLEMIWTLIPAVVLAILIISGLKEWNNITGPAPEDAEIVEVMGYQYAWAFRYPGKDKQLGNYDFQMIDAINPVGIDLNDQNAFDDFMPTQLVIPKGKAVLLKIRGRDVIHSVYNPHFRIQMNAVPGLPTKFWFTPTVSTEEMRTQTGNPDFNYELVCNKICGKSHYGMKGIITVLEQDEYDKWYAEQQEKTWLKLNPGYIEKVPAELQEAAKIAAGIEPAANIKETQTVTASIIN